MNQTTDVRACPGRDCGNELRTDEHLCRPCARRAATAVKHLPELLADLEDTIAGHDRTGPGGAIGSGGESKLPLNLGAMKARNHAQIVVATACEVGYQPDPITLDGTAAAIVADPTKMATHVDGPMLARAIHKAASVWRNVVDPGSERVYAGLCIGCGRELYGTRDSEWIACKHCGAEHDTAASLVIVDEMVREVEYPVHEIRAAIADRAGIKVKPSTFSMWRSRMKLRTWCRVSDRAEVCQVGDYLELAKALHQPAADERISS